MYLDILVSRMKGLSTDSPMVGSSQVLVNGVISPGESILQTRGEGSGSGPL